MRMSIRILPALLIAASLVSFAACGGGGDDATSFSNQGGEDYSDLLVSDAGEALGKSAEELKGEVQSVHGDFSFKMAAGQFDVSASGDFAYQAPDRMHMTMDLSTGGLAELSGLGRLEMLLFGDQLYMHTDATGWVRGSLADLGADSEQLKSLMSEHAPFDYSSLVKDAADVHNLGDEQIGGVKYTHLRVKIDLQEALKSLEGLGNNVPFSASERLTMDFWVDPHTLLPRKLVANGSLDLGDVPGVSGPLTLEIVMNFREYNGSVEIPSPPADAKPFQDAFGGVNPLSGY